MDNIYVMRNDNTTYNKRNTLILQLSFITLQLVLLFLI